MLQVDGRKLKVVIPARYGSSRLPGKPLIDLAGKVLVVRVYEAVVMALGDRAEIIVAVDDDRIRDHLLRLDIPSTMTRSDHESGTDRSAEVARLHSWQADDIVMNVQGDEPLVPIELLRAFASFCEDRDEFSMGTIAAPINDREQIHDPNCVKICLNSVGDALFFSRAPVPFRRDHIEAGWFVENYLRHVGIYAYRNNVLQRLTMQPPCELEVIERLEQLRAMWLGVPIHVLKWGCAPPHGVDTPADADRVFQIFEEIEKCRV